MDENDLSDFWRAVTTLDDYSNNVEDFDPAKMILNKDQDTFILAVDELAKESHLSIPAESEELRVVDALAHGVYIGYLMAKEE